MNLLAEYLKKNKEQQKQEIVSQEPSEGIVFEEKETLVKEDREFYINCESNLVELKEKLYSPAKVSKIHVEDITSYIDSFNIEIDNDDFILPSFLEIDEGSICENIYEEDEDIEIEEGF